MPRARRRWLPRPVTRGGQLLLIALAVEYLLIPQFAGARHSLHLLLDVDSPWLLSTFGLQLASFIAFAFATRAMLPHHSRPPLRKVARIDLATIGLAHTVPGGAAAGTALGLRLLTEAGVPADEAAFAKVAQSVGSALVLVVLLWTALAMAVPLHGSSPLYLAASVVGLAALAGATVTVVVLHRGRPLLARVVNTLASRIPRLAPGAGDRLVARIGTQLDLVLAQHARLVVSTAWAAANWLLNAASLWTAVRAYGHTLGYPGLMVSFTLAHVATWVPITPGGLGIVEGILVPTLVSFSTPRAIAILGVLTYRLASYWLTIPLGGLAYGSIMHTRWRIRLRRRADEGAKSEDRPSP